PPKRSDCRSAREPIPYVPPPRRRGAMPMPRPQPFRFAAHRVVIVSAALLVLLAPASPTVNAQQAQFEWPAHPKNLKVLPKGTTPDQLRDTMVGFTQAL